MKISRIISRLFLFLLFVGFSMSNAALAQEENEIKIRIQIETEENGEKKSIDKTVQSKEDLMELLEELDLNVEISDLENDENIEVIIRKNKEGKNSDIFDMKIDPQFDFHYEYKSEPFLGVRISDINAERATEKGLSSHEGCYVTGIIEGTKAEKTDLQEGDLITAVDGADVKNMDEFIEAILKHQPDDKVSITYLRGSDTRTTNATLGEKKMKCHFSWPEDHFERSLFEFEKMKEDLNSGFLGVTTKNNSDLHDEDTEGVTVASVIKGSPAEKLGLQEDDLITEIEGVKVVDYKTLKNAISSHKKGEEVTVKYKRDNKSKKGNVELSSAVSSYRSSCEVNANELLDDLLKDLPSKEEINDLLEEQEETLRRVFESEDQVIKEMRINIRVEDLSAEDLALINSTQDDARFENSNELDVESLNFYPNPSDGKFKLNFYLPEDGQTTIRIVDAKGKLVYFESLGNFQGRFNKNIDLSGEERGLYFMQVNQNGKTFTKKILTQ